jgi:CubicO group peptidase (beta-lactamase class C family)
MLYEKELDSVLQEIMVRWDIPGLAVGLVQSDEIVYAKGFGVQNLETKTPVTLDSIFCIASISKCFVATAIMQLVERGQIDLDTPLTQYLPYFQLDDERYRKITVRQILSHTSGMPDLDEAEYDELVAQPEWDDGAAERFVRGLKNRKLIANPGERLSYSNMAYDVLGDMLAKVTGKSFERAMQEQLMIPSGMPNSTFLLAEVPPERLAVPHLRAPEMVVNPVYPYHRADAPASFLHSTLLDMCQWGISCLNQGNRSGQNILASSLFDQMWAPVAEWNYPRPSMYEQTGLGWTLGHYKEERTVSHGGMGFGWSDFFLLLPEKNCAVVILGIEESYARTRLVRAAADVLLGHKPQAGAVSWMVPISRALMEGEMQAAYARYDEIKALGDAEYYFDEDDMISLVYQLQSLKKFERAIDILVLNIHAFPEHVESYTHLAGIHLQQGKPAQAEECLEKALSLEPGNPLATGLMEKIRSQRPR